MSQYNGMKHAAAQIIKICQEFMEVCNDETSIDTMESIYQKLARQEHNIRTELNSLTVLGKVVHCPKCKTCNIDIADYDGYIEIMRCKCKECGQFFIENLE